MVTQLKNFVFNPQASQSTRLCNQQSDCFYPQECCAKRAFQDESYCVPMRQLDEICLDGGLDELLVNGKYDINCPCAFGLKCLKQGTITPNGDILYSGLPRCRNSFFFSPYAGAYGNTSPNGGAYAYARK
ncbi:prokineticin domain-containing protein [Trichonephila clavipes]|nr:prokineticin domain-containing protein [Trichonephila clavipes]